VVCKPFAEGKPEAITRCPPDEIGFKWTGHTARSGGITPFGRGAERDPSIATMMVKGRTWVSTIGESEGMPYGETVVSVERLMFRAGDRVFYGSKILNLLTMSD